MFQASPSGATAFYRAYKAADGHHFYTTSLSERDNAIAQSGYQGEGIAGYIFDSPAGNASALYRLVNPTTDDHFYTMSAPERDNAIAQFGYQSEGTAGYIFETRPA